MGVTSSRLGDVGCWRGLKSNFFETSRVLLWLTCTSVCSAFNLLGTIFTSTSFTGVLFLAAPMKVSCFRLSKQTTRLHCFLATWICPSKYILLLRLCFTGLMSCRKPSATVGWPSSSFLLFSFDAILSECCPNGGEIAAKTVTWQITF